MIEENKKADILKMGEVDTYFLIDECGAFMWRMNHDMAHGRIPQEAHAAITEDIAAVREIQQFAVDNLTRFGVDPESAKDRKNGDYWKWYGFWDDWKKGLSDEDWNSVNALMHQQQPYDKFLPKGKWQDYKLE
jgi:hypothetical protein